MFAPRDQTYRNIMSACQSSWSPDVYPPVYLWVQQRLAVGTETSPAWTSWRENCYWCDQGNKSGSRGGEEEENRGGGQELDQVMDHFKSTTCHFCIQLLPVSLEEPRKIN